MHDPYITIKDFSLRLGRYGVFITLWHVDPEIDGTDDSCGWSRPKLTDDERERIKKLADMDRESYSDDLCPRNMTPRMMLYSVYCRIHWDFYGKKITDKNLLHIMELEMNPFDNLLPDATIKEDTWEWRSWWINIYRHIKKFNRPWYKHPKYHFWHWKLTINSYTRNSKAANDACQG